MIRCFARHLAALDPACEVPPPGLLKATARRPAPYLYSPQEIAALITAAGTLRPTMRAVTCQALISLLAATGLRISEALTLARGDVDLDAGVLQVTGKYGKVRLVPLHPTTTSMLARYAACRDRHCPRPPAGRSSSPPPAARCIPTSPGPHTGKSWTGPASHAPPGRPGQDFMTSDTASRSPPTCAGTTTGPT